MGSPPLPMGGAWLPSSRGRGGLAGLLRWGEGEERGSSKERLTRFGGVGCPDDMCMPAYLFFCLLAGEGRATPLGGCGEAGARAALLLPG